MTRRLRHRAQDLALAVVIMAALTLDVLTSSVTVRPVLTLAFLLPGGATLAVRRTRPLVALGTICLGYALTGFLATDITELDVTLPAVLLATYAAGRYGSGLGAPALMLVVAITLVDLGSENPTADDWIFPFCVCGAALMAGRALRNRALVAAALAERSERLAVEQDLRAAEAAVQERRRIARELHDVVAHTLSVMVVQAGAARVTLPRDPARATEALQTVEATGREALLELRRMLGFVGGDVTSALREPQPTTAAIEALTRRAGAAGLPTSYTVEGAPNPQRPLPAGAEVAAYRIVQEALTNALKHAGPGATAAVVVRWMPEALDLEVRDDGAGSGPTAALPSGGHGLVGMRERLALFGGEIGRAHV